MFLCPKRYRCSHLGYVISLVVAVAGRRSLQTSLTITVEAGFQSIPQMLFVMQLTCPQPESMLAYTVAVVYLANVLAASVIALVVMIALDVNHRRTHEKRFVADGHDATPTIAYSYAMWKTSPPRNDSIDSFGTRKGSFTNLTEKF